MKNKLLLCLWILTSVSAFAQLNYEKGYILKKDHQKLEGFLLHDDVYEIPSEFHFRKSLADERSTIPSAQVETVYITPNLKYERHTVAIDDSNTKTGKLSDTRISNFQQKSLLLKVLVEGKTSLLVYKKNNIKRFFIKQGTKVTALEYKKYAIGETKIGYNRNYQKQLKDLFHCGPQNTLKVRYRESDLIDYINQYNSCKGEQAIDYSQIRLKKHTKGRLLYKVKAGVSSTTLGLQVYKSNSTATTFATQLGVELEYLLPFNSRRFSLFLEPTYHLNAATDVKYAAGSGTIPSSGQVVKVYQTGNVSYEGIEIPVGIRHYWFLNDTSSLTLHGGAAYHIPTSSTMQFTAKDAPKTLESKVSFFAGIGYDYHRKYNLELRFNLKRDMSHENVALANYSAIALKFGYTLF